jgi:hypothetical protein
MIPVGVRFELFVDDVGGRIKALPMDALWLLAP